MKRFTALCCSVIAALLFAGHAAGQSQPRRLALVIGNDDYVNVPKLKKAVNDANSMTRELKAAGFEVSSYLNLTDRAQEQALGRFTKAVRGGDEVVLFFAGHGVQIKSGSYLLPVDIEVSSEREVEKFALGLQYLMDAIAVARPAFALVIIDACRDNPLPKAAGRSVGIARGLNPMEPAKGQMVIYSAGKGQSALDRLSDADSDPNGVFTRELIKRMRQPGVKVRDLVDEVQDSVEKLAQSVGRDQRPAVYSEARGNFYFFAPTAPSAPPPSAAVPGVPPRCCERNDSGTRPRPSAPATPIRPISIGTPTASMRAWRRPASGGWRRHRRYRTSPARRSQRLRPPKRPPPQSPRQRPRRRREPRRATWRRRMHRPNWRRWLLRRRARPRKPVPAATRSAGVSRFRSAREFPARWSSTIPEIHPGRKRSPY